jgi:hypothetical protein
MTFLTTTNYLSKTQFSQAKSRLTRAINSGDHRRILDTVEETFAEWDAGDFAYPDDWHRWERARWDAEFALRRAGR